MNIKTLLLCGAMMLGASTAMADTDEFYYYNPVIPNDAPDPTIIRDVNDGNFYLFHTGGQVPMYRSKNLVNWTKVGNAFTSYGRPTFVQGGGVWAPDINYVNGQYVLYYSMSKWGGEWECGLGVATSPDLQTKFTDHGKLFISSEIGVQNSIDPFFYEEEDGSKYLFWGSFRGIYAIELSEDGLSVKEGAEKKKIAGTLTEGTYIYKRDGFYYLFGSAGTCCDGLNSTYRLVVARSRKLLGTYYDREGKSVLENNFTEVMHKSNNVVGPGHCSEIVEDDAGRTWIMYHGYRASNTNGRCAFLDEVLWDQNGWPYITGERPSDHWDKPIIGEDNFTYSDVDYIEYTGDDDTYNHCFDTGYVPKSNTKILADCYTYSEVDDEPTTGEWRAVFSGRTSYNNGFSLYVNPDGQHWGYFAGGYKNDFFAPHEFDTKYHVEATLGSLNINGESYPTNQSNYNSAIQRLTIFGGTQDKPYVGRIYNLSIYQGTTLIGDFVPRLRNEDEMVVFYDKVRDRYIRPRYFDGFSYGYVEDGIKDVVSGSKTMDSRIFDLQGRIISEPTHKGIYIQDGKKYIK